MFRMGTLGLASLLTMSAMSFAQTPVEHGRYLVEGVLTCGNCHSPRGPGGVIDTTRLYSGGPQTWDEIRPTGVQLASIMPYGFYKVFTTRDLDAVVAYLRSTPAVGNKVEPPVYKAAIHVDIPPGAEKPMTEAELQDPIAPIAWNATPRK